MGTAIKCGTLPSYHRTVQIFGQLKGAGDQTGTSANEQIKDNPIGYLICAYILPQVTYTFQSLYL